MPLTDEERNNRPQGTEHFLRYTHSADRGRAYQCLEHGGDSAPADVQLDLYWLIVRSPQVAPANPYKWLRKAAYGGDANAQFIFSRQIMTYLLSGVSPDMPPEVRDETTPERYHYWLKSAADKGLSQARYLLAQLYLGRYDKDWRWAFIDIPLAINLLEENARQASEALERSRAAAALGELYFTGNLVPRDYPRALKWFSTVEERFILYCRDPLAWVRIALVRIYKEGLGVEANPDKVAYYMRTAGGCD